MFSEKMTVFSIFLLKWSIKSCDKKSLMEAFPKAKSLEKVYVVTKDMVWNPTLISSYESYESDENLEDDFLVTVRPNHYEETPNQTVDFYLARIGFFDTNCKPDLTYFPFDETTCHFEFIFHEQAELVQFNNTFPICPKRASTEWIFVDCYSPAVSYELQQSHRVSKATFSIAIKRNPIYYLVNLALPNLTFSFLILASFLVHPESPIRPMLAVVLMLSLVVGHDNLVGQIPRKIGFLLLRDFMFSLTCLSVLITLYHLISLYLVNLQKSSNETTNHCSKYRRFDVAVFFVHCAIFGAILLYFGYQIPNLF